jgi:uncharacterized protein
MLFNIKLFNLSPHVIVRWVSVKEARQHGQVFQEAEKMNASELLREKREEILRIAARRGAHNVRLFGSVARGQNDSESDVDFLVDMEPGRSLLDLGGLWSDLNDLLGMRVDVVTEKGLRKRIRERVLKEAIPL